MSIATAVTLPKINLSPVKAISPQVYDWLRKLIIETTITPGTQLSENSLSTKIKVSRQPVREALMRLSYEGLISIMPQRGSIVERISISNLTQTVFVRTAIEKECLRSFAHLDKLQQHRILGQLEKLIELQQQCKHDDKIRANYFHLDDLFHEKICAISGSPLPWNTIQSIKGQMDRVRFLSFNIVPIANITSEHEAIIACLKQGDIATAVSKSEFHLSQILEDRKSIVIRYYNWFTADSLKIIAQELGTTPAELLEQDQVKQKQQSLATCESTLAPTP